MAIHNTETEVMQGGFAKEIEASSMHMALDVLQKFQYQYPIKSTIRELVSNAVDSTVERENAIAIIKGEAQVSDFYIQRDEDMYKDSNWDPTYYDQKWLSTEKKVKVIYEEGDNLQRDKVRIIDCGVGLGGKRLDGYFKLNWSSKRNNIKALGKWGLGAKAALSAGVDYYTVINRYNGMEMIFNVYSHKVDSIIPPFEFLPDGTKRVNQYVTMYQGTTNEYHAYWRPTTQPNGLEVIVETKKHRKQEYLEAVKSQLMYFDNVELLIKNEYGEQHVPHVAKVLYEDDYLIVSDNNQYSKPHLVINKVNYGHVDFQELELEQKFGPVGIKVAAEEVEVSPSRESVIWSDVTKDTVVKRFRQAAEAATKLVQAQLNTTDFVQWLRIWASIKNRNGYSYNQDALSKLSGIVDMSQIEPVFPGDATLKAGTIELLFPGMQVQKITKQEPYKGGQRVQKLVREDVRWVPDLGSGAPIYITNQKPSVKALRYLATANQYSGFYLIRYPENLEVEGAADAEETESWIKAFSLYPAFDKIKDGANDVEIKKSATVATALPVLKERRKRVVALLEKSINAVDLSRVNVPDDFKWLDEEEVTADTVVSDSGSVTYLSAEERRKLEERVVAFTPRGFEYVPDRYGVAKGEQKLFEWQKIEPKLAKVKSLDGEDVYYGTQKDEVALMLAAAITQPAMKQNFYGRTYTWSEIHDGDFKSEWGLHNTVQYSCQYLANWGPKAKATVLKVAEGQVKHYKAYKHVSGFFLQTDNDEITMAQALIKWHTARLVQQELSKLKFLNNFGSIDHDRADKYKKLVDYVNTNYVDVQRLSRGDKYYGITEDVYNEMIDHHDKVMQLQLYIAKHADDTDLIAAKSKELFDAEFKGATGVEMEIYELLQELLEYSEPIRTLLNRIKEITEAAPGSTINPNLETEIVFYLNAKGV